MVHDVVEEEVLETRETETWLGLVTREKDTIITGVGGERKLKIKNFSVFLQVTRHASSLLLWVFGI